MTSETLSTLPRLPASEELLARARDVDAMAAARGSVIASDQVIPGEYPAYVRSASGAFFTDVDGNRYLDFLLAYGTVILGYADPRVDDAVVAEIRSGFSTGHMKPVQATLARELVDLIPGAESALFFKTGSDATGSAVRLSRAYTGRDRIVRWGYNGWHDWCAQRPTGIPAATRGLVDEFEYNDIDSLKRVFDAHPGEIACVVMMPFKHDEPRDRFLEKVRELTSDHGTLLVFDEMRSGFRMAIGGAQQFFGVRADLVTFSKAFANGYAISALTGPTDVMSTLKDVHISSTYYVNGDGMAAALATLRVLRDTDALDRVWALGQRFQDGLRGLAERSGTPIRVVGYPPMPFLEFDYTDQDAVVEAKRVFYTETIRRGIYYHPNHHWYLCEAMTEADVDAALDAAEAAFGALARDLPA